MVARESVSINELIRQSLDLFIQNQSKNHQNELVENAKKAVGKYYAGLKDLAQNHDQYLVEDFQK